jgi:hypothetical protein
MTCKLAHKDMGWGVFFAYSDTDDASEVGTVYQACGWHYIGTGLGRSEGGHHADFLSPDGNRIITSYQLNHDKERKILKSLGWKHDENAKELMRPWLRNEGWTEIKRYGKKKWITFVGTDAEKREMRAACRYTLDLPYPKDRTPKVRTTKT